MSNVPESEGVVDSVGECPSTPDKDHGKKPRLSESGKKRVRKEQQNASAQRRRIQKTAAEAGLPMLQRQFREAMGSWDVERAEFQAQIVAYKEETERAMENASVAIKRATEKGFSKRIDEAIEEEREKRSTEGAKLREIISDQRM
jgi:hypothetical protein